MNKLVASARDTVRAQLWPLPVAAVLLAVVAGVLLPMADVYWDSRLPPGVSGLLFGGDAGAARTLLDAIASSLITVTSLTFSLTVVTLQLASSQFSPRLLRTFTSDVFVQATLAVFLATFTYALTVLRGVRSGDAGSAAFVPRISVTVAFVLGIASVLGLVLFLAHLARQIRVETMLRDVHQEASATVRVATAPRPDGDPPTPVPTPPPDAIPLTAPSSGFLVGIDEAELLSAAVAVDAVLLVESHPGSSLVEGVPVGMVWSSAKRLDDDAVGRLRDALAHGLRIGYERTASQDVGYGLRQLTDVANKALSPGINDPTTAVHALGHVSALLCQLADRDLGAVFLRDDDDEVRVVLQRPSLGDLIDMAVTQPRRYGSSDPEVMLRLFTLLEELAHHVHDREPIRLQLGRLRATVATSDFDQTEAGYLERAARRVETVMDRPVRQGDSTARGVSPRSTGAG